MRDPAVFDALVASYHPREWDAAHYVELCRDVEGPVLELGVGTGRVVEPLLEAGCEVWGIDLNEAMLSAAKERTAAHFGPRPAAHLHLADARDFDLGRRFALVLASYNFLALVPPADLPAVSNCVKEHLEPEGVWAFDFIVADATAWARMSAGRRSVTELTVDGTPVEYEVTARFDPDTRLHQLDERVSFPDGRVVDERLTLYQWRVDDLVSRLEGLGWMLVEPLRDHRGAPYTSRARICCGRLRRVVGRP